LAVAPENASLFRPPHPLSRFSASHKRFRRDEDGAVDDVHFWVADADADPTKSLS
jgi:hypothetical protein